MAGRDAAAELATRPVGHLLWWACTQTTLSVGAYGIYAVTSAWFVSRGVGEVALAAVNLVAPLLLLVGAVSTTMGVGGASLVSRSLGSGTADGRPGPRAPPSRSSGWWRCSPACWALRSSSRCCA